MSISDDEKVARLRNLLILLAREAVRLKTRAHSLKEAEGKELNGGRRAGLRTLLHCTNRQVQFIELCLSSQRAASREFFDTAVVETIAKQKIILHKL